MAGRGRPSKFGEEGILRTLSQGGEMTISEIAARLGCSRENVEYHLIRPIEHSKTSMVERGLAQITSEISYETDNPTYLGPKQTHRKFKITPKGLRSLEEKK